jgi:hypothetical protein
MSDINMGNTVTTPAQDMITITSSGITSGITMGSTSYTTATSGPTISINTTSVHDLLDRRDMNLIVVDHKVSEMEMLKLKEVQPDYADHIKENIAKKATREVINKMTFTKKKLPDEDTHHFYGRVYVFTKEELIQLIEEARNA